MWSYVSLVGARLDDSTRRLLVGGLVVAVFLLGVGHLFAIREIDGLALGVPNWLWIELAVLGLMLVLAWIAVGLATGGESR